MTGYPPDVVRYEQRQVEVQGMLSDLPQSQREFYSGALAALGASYQLETDGVKRVEIEQKFSVLESSIRSEYNRAINDPVDRTLGIFNAPMGEGYLNKFDRQRVDLLERFREDFLDAANSTERRAILSKAAELKSSMQAKVNFSLNIARFLERGRWAEANQEVDRILQAARAQTDPATRYELIGRQLFQMTPGQDDLKDRIVLAFTQRMHDSESLRNELYDWHAQVSKPLNAESVSGPKRYTDILANLPPVGPDYIRDLNDKYTAVLKDASDKNYSITPEAKAKKLASQVLEGVMRIMFELSPIGPMADLIPSTLPDNVRMGLEFGGMIMGAFTGAGAIKQSASAVRAVAAAARSAELDNAAAAGVRAAAKGLVDDAAERIVRETAEGSAMSPQAKEAAEALTKKALGEAGPPVDPTSMLAHDAVGLDSNGSLVTYAAKDVSLANLHQGSRPGVLEDAKGDRFVELGGNVYHVRFDNDNSTWRVFDKENRYRPQFPVRLDEATNTWELHGDVGLQGGGKISEAMRQRVIALLNEGDVSRRGIAEELGISPSTIQKIAKEQGIGLTAPDSLRSLGLTPATREEALGLLRDGELLRAEIAERLGISRAAVSKLAKDNGITPARNAVNRVKITPEIRERVRGLIDEQKYSDAQIATQVGISRASVINIRKEMPADHARSLRVRKVTPAMKAEIINALNEGVSVTDIAKTNGVSTATVSRIKWQKDFRSYRPPTATQSQGSPTAGPSTAGPSTAGPSTAGPSTAGTSTAGPSTAGTSTAGPSTAGPSTAGPSTAGPSTAGPSTAGTSTAGPSTAGTSTAGTSTAGPSTAGPSTAGTSTAGTSTAGPSTRATFTAGATKEQIDKIFDLRNRGESVPDIAAAVGISRKKVMDIYANVNSYTYQRSWWDTSPANRSAALWRLDRGLAPKDIAKDLGLPIETILGIANQQRFARNSLAIELLNQGETPEQVMSTLRVSRAYLDRLREGVPKGTHDIHFGSEESALATDMFAKGYTREDVAEKLGISRWRAHSLANEFREKTMDSVMPSQLQDLVRALNDPEHTFTTQELARATGLSESTVTVVENEFELGSIVPRSSSPVAGSSSSTVPHDTGFEWARPLTMEQEKQALNALASGQTPNSVATQLHVNPAAVERLSEYDAPLVAPSDDPIVPSTSAAPAPGGTPSTIPSLVPLSEQDKAEIRMLSRRNLLSSGFIADLFEIPLASVEAVLRSR
ncbi:helix-turn-helix domain-containing protein [Paraburkholderia flagellata]|uniref:helix-turn-helix domain-containing protein n=1 Tax=Paraburkholderia flagellata TaxID=2883241 RepID=UPI001F43054B|nr:helix-turn-helix domain-containing protein [Paraburkholderia flagellata]